MTIAPTSSDPRRTFIRRAMMLVLRLMGLALFAFGIGYWVRLVGVYDAPDWRFDLMARSWRLAAPALAVLCPVAGVGLWLAASWGVVTWVLVVAIEATMHFGFASLFGGTTLELALNLAGLAALALLRVADWFFQRSGARGTAG